MREGNQRLTKAKYSEVINDVIEWTWFIAKKINPALTGKRVIRVDVPIVAEPSVQRSQPLKNRAPLQSSQAPIETIKQTTTTQSTSEKTEDVSTKDCIQKTDKVIGHQSDVDLINALDKLAKLKKQGLLTAAEFDEAKDKILKNLTDE
jgi:hypothetical protein